MVGFCRTIRDEKNSEIWEHMPDYLISSLDDAGDFLGMQKKPVMLSYYVGWSNVKLEKLGTIDQIDAIRRANAQRHVSPTKKLNNDKKFNQKTTNTMTYFNQNSRNVGKIHEINGVLYQDICSHCFSSMRITFSHSEMDFHNKSKGSKNESKWMYLHIESISMVLDVLLVEIRTRY